MGGLWHNWQSLKKVMTMIANTEHCEKFYVFSQRFLVVATPLPSLSSSIFVFHWNFIATVFFVHAPKRNSVQNSYSGMLKHEIQLQEGAHIHMLKAREISRRAKVHTDFDLHFTVTFISRIVRIFPEKIKWQYFWLLVQEILSFPSPQFEMKNCFMYHSFRVVFT